MNKRTEEKLKSIEGMKTAMTEILAQAWERGKKYGMLEAQESSSWIPVSKSLPEKKGYFLTSTVFNDVYCDFWNGETFERTEMILAWMPLPEPYKKEDDT